MSSAKNKDGVSRVEVLPSAMIRLSGFCDGQMKIQQGEQFLENKTFDSEDVEWLFIWALADGDAGKALQLYNTREFRIAFRRTLARGMIWVRRAGYFAYWYLQGNERVKWWRAFLEAPSAAAREELGQPWGVLEPTECITSTEQRAVGGPLSRRMVSRPMTSDDDDDDDNGGMYGYAVYDHNTTLVPADQTLFAALMTQRRGRNDERCQTVVPRSGFFELLERYEMVSESRVYHMDAEHAVSQPRLIVQANAPQINRGGGAAEQQQTTQQLFDHATTIDALLAQETEPLHFSYDAMSALLEEQEAALGAQQTSSSEWRRLAFHRPSMFEKPHKLLGLTQLAHVNTPHVINDLAEMEDRLTNEVAAVLRIPAEILTQPARSAASLSAAGTHQDATLLGGARDVTTTADRRLQETLSIERRIYEDMAAHVMRTVFAPLDALALDTLDAALQAHQNALDDTDEPDGSSVANGRAALVAEVHALVADAMATDDGGNNNSNSNSKKKKDEDRPAPRRATLAQTRALLQRLRTRASGRGGLARLVFRASQSPMVARQVTGLLEVYKLGILEEKYLEGPMRELFTLVPNLRLRAPPEPAPPAGKAAGPPAKKQKK